MNERARIVPAVVFAAIVFAVGGLSAVSTIACTPPGSQPAPRIRRRHQPMETC